MGMSASQARLLTLTAGIHDVEYESQKIQNAKLDLATQSDNIYKEYLEALDATTLTIKNENGDLISANYTNLCGMNAIRLTDNAKMALLDNKGRLIVNDNIYTEYKKFEKYGVDDAQLFALWMLDKNSIGNTPEYNDVTSDFYKKLAKAEKEFIENDKSLEFLRDNNTLGSIIESLNTELKDRGYADRQIEISEENYLNPFNENYSDLDSYTLELINNAKKEYIALLEESRYKLYQKESENIAYAVFGESAQLTYDENTFNYYVDTYKLIKACGGDCINISEFNGIINNSNAATDGDWLQSQIKTGNISVERAVIDSKNGKVSLSKTSPVIDSNLSYTTTTTIDKTALTRAEAKYEKSQKEIDQKDKKFDVELSKLETERNALMKQFEATKKIIDDNISRTYGIFGGN